MATRPYQGIKFDTDGASKVLDALTVEEALQININNEPFTVSMRTPGEDPSLVRGMLHAEDIIRDVSFCPEIHIKKENEKGIVTIVNINIPEKELGQGYNNSRSLLSVSSCGICGKTELSDLAFSGAILDPRQQLEAGLIPGLFDSMRKNQEDFNRSGGTHAATAFTLEGELLCTMEDIGRHNAVDKVVGRLILERRLREARIMTVSGRISYEIVIKCFKAGIPFLAAVSAPSSLAVDYAKELGITLFAFSRNGRTTCYAHPERTGLPASNNTKAS
ncbi:formate dehydrogenase accessory sulfurtransferase FdhD [Robertkochia flava]|uniref:formate dehydrogenase accessory sulfurtransferase FdhD n=1 Tax=Robertkochia flava TaxID=3447986 RepID=UPI001CCE21A8|nr:formate dehydrogenase accessory sulfurtransferase FdhD [Robertkochia marina]